MQEFHKFLDEEKIPYTQQDLVENNDWIRYSIKSEIFVDQFGQDEGLKIRAENDPQIIKALELLPQARALDDHAKEVIAQHNSRACDLAVTDGNWISEQARMSSGPILLLDLRNLGTWLLGNAPAFSETQWDPAGTLSFLHIDLPC